MTLSSSMLIKETWRKVNQKGSTKSTKGRKCSCTFQRRWRMARKSKIRRRMEKNMEDDQMWPLSIKIRIEYYLLVWFVQVTTMWMQSMQRWYKNSHNSHLGSERQSRYNVMIIPIVIGCFGKSMKTRRKEKGYWTEW